MVITEMFVSVDGEIAGPDNDFSWGVPDEELHRFRNNQLRPLGAHGSAGGCTRRLSTLRLRTS